MSCESLESVTIPDSVTSIGSGAFVGCGKLSLAVIGKNVSSIGKQAFKDCSELAVAIVPKALLQCIESDEVFAGCPNVTIAYYEGDVPSIGDLERVTVTLDGNGGETTVASLNPFSGSAIGSLPRATRPGFVFSGWSTAADGGDEVTSHSSFGKNATIYAKWVECPFMFGGAADWTYDEESGVYRSGTIAGTGVSSASMDVTGPGKISFKWRTSMNGGCVFRFYVGDSFKRSISGNMDNWSSVTYDIKESDIPESGTLTLKWEYEITATYYGADKGATLKDVAWKTPVNVTFDENWDGAETIIRQVICGDTLGSLPSATRSGYALVGWFTDPTAGTQVTSETIVGADMTVYAHWMEAVSFDSTGGDANWTVESDGSWKSGTITHSQSTWAQVTVTGPCEVSFKWKVSSESGYDYLTFTVDGGTGMQISGTGSDWETKLLSISDSGSHVLKWTYSKDGSAFSGSDCGWVKDFLAISPEPSAPEASVDTEKLDEGTANKLDSLDVEVAEETGVRTIAVKEGETLTQEEVAAIAESIVIEAAIAGSSEKVDTSAGYDVNYDTESNEIVITLKTPEMDTTVEDEKKEAGDSTGMLVDADEVTLSTEEPTPSEEDVAAGNTEVAALPVKSVRGLYYQASWGSSLEGMTEGQKVQATGSTLNLGVIKQKGSCGFYKLSVSEK